MKGVGEVARNTEKRQQLKEQLACSIPSEESSYRDIWVLEAGKCALDICLTLLVRKG